jgi:hypothetical protein
MALKRSTPIKKNQESGKNHTESPSVLLGPEVMNKKKKYSHEAKISDNVSQVLNPNHGREAIQKRLDSKQSGK